MAMHSATTILDDIIDELRLKFDSSVGLLDGDAVRELPNLNTLQNLSKLLAKLAKALDHTEEIDKTILKLVEAALAAPPEAAELAAPEPEAEPEEELAEAENGTAEPTAVKREASDMDLEDETIPLAKRKKQGSDAQSADAAKLDDAAIEDQEPPESESLNSKDDPVPPVQTGSFTQDNDTRLKNPKSEFVPSQALSASAMAELGLFSEKDNGLETHGKEYLKRKYGVASYPENDLKSMLPGEIPNIDFSKTKAPTNQVQFSTYQLFIESYFRPFTNEDVAFLREKFVIPPGFEKNYDPLTSPYVIPKLGNLYTDVWAEEDAALGTKLSSPAIQRPPLESYKPKGDADQIADDKLLTEDVSCGPLSSRLLSAVLSIHEVKNKNGFDGDGNDEDDGEGEADDDLVGNGLFDDDSPLNFGDAYKDIAEASDFHSLEERLRRELKYIGVFLNLPIAEESKPKKGGIIDSDEWILNKEDDEVCAEMRALQEELKSAVTRNRRRKKILAPILEEHLAYQEYCTILEDLDKQVDQAYIKRLKAKNKKKKTNTETVNLAQQQAANSGLRTLLEKRSRWIANIGKLFPPPEMMKRIASESIFKSVDQSDDEEGDADVEVGEAAQEAT